MSETESYLFSGFHNGSATSFCDYLVSKELLEGTQLIDNFINSKLFSENDKGISFKLLITLLCTLSNKKNYNKYYAKAVIRQIKGKSTNKQGEELKDNP